MPEFLQHSGGREGPKSGLCCAPCWALDPQPLPWKGPFFLAVLLPPRVIQLSNSLLHAGRCWGDTGRTGPVPALIEHSV